jgi:hypothetical protein
MVLGVVSNKGDVMPPHIFEAGLRVNTKIYLDVLTNVVKPCMDGVAAGRPYLHLAAGRGDRPHHQEDPGVVQGQPPLLLGEGDLASQLT